MDCWEYACVCHQYNITITRSQDLTLPEYRCALSPGVLEPANLLRKGLNWLTHHLSRGCKNPESKVIQLKMLHQTRELESTLPMTDVQPLEVQNKMISSETVLCPILWGINYRIFMPVKLDEISNSIVDTCLKFV
jgi:hypothetical protein